MDNQCTNWWRGGVIYQVYPRSYCDTTGTGIGDLRGVTEKLDYIASLGVDAIWLSPFFKSPMKDYGYDISDYLDVDPMFGTLDDFDALRIKAHSLGLKIMVDQVMSHTSEQHHWFEESRQSRDNPKADWYVWADPLPDGSPPNNWLSIFGGPAWEWDPRRRQYYLHNFLASQPDLNFHNPEVQQTMLDVMEFWLKRGVDGFRLDVVNFYFHDQALRSNPPAPDPFSNKTAPPDNPYILQQHLYDKSQPENVQFLERMRELVDRYGDCGMVGELGADADQALSTMAEYTAGDRRLHMAYSFELLTAESSAAYIRKTIEDLESQIGDGWPCWAMGNHDVMRVASRWSGGQPSAQMAKAFMVLLLSLRGSVCIYQGEELGLEEAEIAYEQIRDPYGIAFWPLFKGRDGCRTPMPWTSDSNGGFTSGVPWLPVPAEHRAQSVSNQEMRNDSLLNAYRQFLAWRKEHPALRTGSIRFIDVQEQDVLCFVRATEQERLLIVLNLSHQTQRVVLPQGLTPELLPSSGCNGHLDGDYIELPAWDACIGMLPVSVAEGINGSMSEDYADAVHVA